MELQTSHSKKWVSSFFLDVFCLFVFERLVLNLLYKLFTDSPISPTNDAGFLFNSELLSLGHSDDYWQNEQTKSQKNVRHCELD